jgi:hypothetical protein
MLLKLLAIAVAVIPVLLFLRSMMFKRPTRVGENFRQFKRQFDILIWMFIAAIGVVGAIAFARMAWIWWQT